MIALLTVAASVALGGSAVVAILSNWKRVSFDRRDPGAWMLDERKYNSALAADINSMILRLDRARVDTASWEMLLRRLDALHVQLSPFGKNARRPPYAGNWWSQLTQRIWAIIDPTGSRPEHAINAEAPKRYDARYLETYIKTLEQLAGVTNGQH